MQEITPLRFSSAIYEQEIMGICQVHGIDFAEAEAGVRRRHIIVEPGDVNYSDIEIGKKRFVENGSGRLSDLLYGAVMGIAAAMGKPVKEDTSEILDGLIF